MPGQVVRVEPGGVVIVVPSRRFAGGEDVRVWLTVDDRACSFEASVIRAGVPVPDRSQDGILLGYLDRWTESAGSGTGVDDCVVEVLPPNGPPVSLVAPPVRLVDVTTRDLSFSVPADFPLIFVRQGTVSLRLGLPGRAPVSLLARVQTLAPGQGAILYALTYMQVDDADRLREVVEGIDQRLGA